jgi:hypothetical protein
MHLESFSDYFSNFSVKKNCVKYLSPDYVSDYKINSDGSVDVVGSVYVKGDGNFGLNLKLKKLPLNFHTISNSFSFTDCSLETLSGCPVSIGGPMFNVSGNQLRTFQYAPKSVNGILISFADNPLLPMFEDLNGGSKILLKYFLGIQDDYHIYKADGTVFEAKFKDCLEEAKELTRKWISQGDIGVA